MNLRCLDLFAGVGGFAKGFEELPIQTTQFVEINISCQQVLSKHWPEVPIYGDIKSFHAKENSFDIICGGFPCQDISVAGTGQGLAGLRSGLWAEYSRVIGEVKPSYVIIENSSNLRNRGLDTVLKDLWKNGYDAEWHVLEAGQFGAPHVRERIFIVAYPIGKGGEGLVKNEYLKEIRSRWLCGSEDLYPIYDNPFRRSDCWPQPLLRRGDDGLSRRVDRLRQIGNSVYPPIIKFLGQCIVEHAKNNKDT